MRNNVSLEAAEVFDKKAALKNFAVFTEKCRCFPVNIAKFLRTPVLKNICERLFKGFATGPNNKTSNRK